MSRGFLFQKYGISMPLKKLTLWSVLNPWRHPYFCSFQLEIVLPIVEICLEPPTDSKLKIGADRYISSIKQCMHVRTQQKAIVNLMLPPLSNRLDMCRLQNRQSLLSRDGTSPLICIGHQNPEGTLP